ncbi:MAG: mitochondrial fission ELM1 family protein [Burkholderiales bacterium]|nr:mitochondrial fission ELM1 family protein [Burkholderiales bacterium]
MSGASTSAEVWLLTGNRAGEVAQQRIVAAALGLPVRELQVARMAPTGRGVSFDFSALQPPWPRLAISFGKTLAAALRLRELGAGATRLVHLGLPRRLAVGALDLIVPMPTDRYVAAPNVLSIRMPFNPAPRLAADAPEALRLRAAGLPRPWTALIVGGHTQRLRLEPRELARIAALANTRVLARHGSLLVTTSPRTPAEALPLLREQLTAPGELHVFGASGAAANPYAAYLNLADELIVTGDSASMIAECWRSGKPLWVARPAAPPHRRLMRTLRRAVPHSLIAAGHVAGDVDVTRWIDGLARAGHIGLLGRSDPVLAYDATLDDDLSRTVARIRALIAPPPT